MVDILADGCRRAQHWRTKRSHAGMVPTILHTTERLWCYEERDCCRFVALNLDLLHGERSPPVERASR
jgi:hypothetical protein